MISKKRLEEILSGLTNISWEVQVQAPQKVVIRSSGELDSLTFEPLDALSGYFGTKKINFGTETRRGGYCETCEYTEKFVMLTIWDITQGLYED